MLRRRLSAPAVALVAALALGGCVGGGGEPTPTPTVLTEEEAYAAAESAFRAYIDAVNQIEIADPATFEPAFALTTGRLSAQDRATYSQWHADHWVEHGDLAIELVEPVLNDSAMSAVHLAACLDASAVSVVDDSGESQIASDRKDVQAIDVQVDWTPSRKEWLVSRIQTRDGPPEC